MDNSKGFTLIELIIVIVILGLLSATAAPKFMDLQKDARIASIQGMSAAVKSASTMVYSKSVIQGTDKVPSYYGRLKSGAMATKEDNDGVTVNTSYGYPTPTVEGIIRALQSDDSFVDRSNCNLAISDWCYEESNYNKQPVIFIYPSSSVGFVNNTEQSCVLMYSLNVYGTGKVEAENVLMTGGC